MYPSPVLDYNNWLDAVDGSLCTFEGGDDPTQVRNISSEKSNASLIRVFRTASTLTHSQEALMVGLDFQSGVHTI